MRPFIAAGLLAVVALSACRPSLGRIIEVQHQLGAAQIDSASAWKAYIDLASSNTAQSDSGRKLLARLDTANARIVLLRRELER